MNFKGENTKIPKRWMDIDKMPFEHLLYMKYRQKRSDELHFLVKYSRVYSFDAKCQLCKKYFKVSELRAHFATVKHLKRMNEVAELHYNQEERILQPVVRGNASQTMRSGRHNVSSISEEVYTKDETGNCSGQIVENGNNSDTVKRQDTIKAAQTIKNCHNSAKQAKKLWPKFDMDDSNQHSGCSQKNIKESNAAIEPCSGVYFLNLYLDFWPQSNLSQKALYEFSNYETWRKEKVKTNECDEGILSAYNSKTVGQRNAEHSYETDEINIIVPPYDINSDFLENQHKINAEENDNTEVVQTCNIATGIPQTPTAEIPKFPSLCIEDDNQQSSRPQKHINGNPAVIKPRSAVNFLNLYLDFWPPGNLAQKALYEFSHYETWRKEKVKANEYDEAIVSACNSKLLEQENTEIIYRTDEINDVIIPSNSDFLEKQHNINAAKNDNTEVVQTYNVDTGIPQTPAAEVRNQQSSRPKKTIKRNHAVIEPCSAVPFLNLYLDFWPSGNLSQALYKFSNYETWRKENVKANEYDEAIVSAYNSKLLDQENAELAYSADEIDVIIPSCDINSYFQEKQHTINTAENGNTERVQTSNKATGIPQTSTAEIPKFPSLYIEDDNQQTIKRNHAVIDPRSGVHFLNLYLDFWPSGNLPQKALFEFSHYETWQKEKVNQNDEVVVSACNYKLLDQENAELAYSTNEINDIIEPSDSDFLENQHKINAAENDNTEVVQTCSIVTVIPQPPAINIPNCPTLGVEDSIQLQCCLQKIIKGNTTSFDPCSAVHFFNLYLDFWPQNILFQALYEFGDYERWRPEKAKAIDRDEAVPSPCEFKLLSQDKTNLKYDIEKIDVPSTEITSHSLENYHTINDKGNDRMEVAQTYKEIPQTNAAIIPKHVYNMLQMRDLLKMKFKTKKDNKFRPVFTKDKNVIMCHICNNYTLRSRGYAVRHSLEGEVHIRRMNERVIEIYHPECSWLQFTEGMSMHEYFLNLVTFLADPSSDSLEEFIEAMRQPIDDLLKVVILEPSGEWNSMLTFEDDMYSCNLCKRMQLVNESAVKEHCQSPAHIDNGKFMLQSYGKSSSDCQLAEPDTTSIPKKEMQTESKITNQNSTMKQFMSKCASMSIEEILNIQFETAEQEDLYMITRNMKQYSCNICKTFTTVKAKEIRSHLLSANHLANMNHVKEFKHLENQGSLQSSVQTNVEKINPAGVLESITDSWEPIAKTEAVESEVTLDSLVTSSSDNNQKWSSDLTSANEETTEITPAHKRILEQFMLKCAKMDTNEILKIQYRTADDDDMYMIKKIRTHFFICFPCKVTPAGTSKKLKDHLLTRNHLNSICVVKEFKHPEYYGLLNTSVESNDEKIFLPVDVLKGANGSMESTNENVNVQAKIIPNALVPDSNDKDKKLSSEKYNEKMKRNANAKSGLKATTPNGAMNLKEFRKKYTKLPLKNLLEVQYRKKPADWHHMLKIIDGQYYCNLCGGEFLGSRKNLQSHLSRKLHSTNVFSVDSLYHPTSFPGAISYTPKPKTDNIEEYVNGARLSTLPDAESASKAESESLANSTSHTKPLQQNDIKIKSSDILLESQEINSSRSSQEINSLGSSQEINSSLTIEAFKLNYMNLPAEELMKLEYKKTPTSDWNLMIHENPVQYRCNLCCRMKLKDAENVISHLNSNFHILNMESVKAMYNPRHYLLQSASPNNKGKSADLKNEKRLKEFKLKYAEMELDDILKVQFKTSGNTWQYMIENEEIRFLCILCWRISLRTKDDISSHIRTSFHRENMKEVTELHHPVCFPSKGSFRQIEKTELPREKRIHKKDKQAKIVQFDLQTLSSNAKSLGILDSDAKGVSDGSKSSSIINGVLKLIAEHEQWCKNAFCDLACAHADIRARAYLIDDYDMIDDAIKNRGDEIIDEYDKMKRNQNKLMQSINVRSNSPNDKLYGDGITKSYEKDSLVKTVTNTDNVQNSFIPNVLSPMNPWNISSASSAQKSVDKNNPTQKHSTDKASDINNENISPIADYEGIMKLLRHISALEHLLGSLGPRSTELLKKTFKLYKENSYYSPSSDDVLLLETIREKLVGLLEIDVLNSKEIPAVKHVLVEIRKYVDNYEQHSMTLGT